MLALSDLFPAVRCAGVLPTRCTEAVGEGKEALTLFDRSPDAREPASVTVTPLLTRRLAGTTAPVLLVALAAPDRAL